jgi:hypothetical protein
VSDIYEPLTDGTKDKVFISKVQAFFLSFFFCCCFTLFLLLFFFFSSASVFIIALILVGSSFFLTRAQSYDATSHFESATDDVLSLYKVSPLLSTSLILFPHNVVIVLSFISHPGTAHHRQGSRFRVEGEDPDRRRGLNRLQFLLCNLGRAFIAGSNKFKGLST